MNRPLNSPCAPSQKGFTPAFSAAAPWDDDWAQLLALLPDDLETSARQAGALSRRRGVRDAQALLRLALVYGAGGLSLRSTATWARQARVAQLSDVALRKRLRRATPWLGRLLAQVLAARTQLPEALPHTLRLRVLDATTLSRTRSQGTDLRVHLCWDLATQSVADLEWTPATGTGTGERLSRLACQPGDVLIADRGYAHRREVAAVHEKGIAVLLRFCERTFPLETPEGQPFDLLAAVAHLAPGAVAEFAVRTAAQPTGKHPIPAAPGRVVVIRKSAQAAEAARRRVREAAKKKGRTPCARALEAAAFLWVFTTVAAAALPAEAVLAVYRFRWQIELAFKPCQELALSGRTARSRPGPLPYGVAVQTAGPGAHRRSLPPLGGFFPLGAGRSRIGRCPSGASSRWWPRRCAPPSGHVDPFPVAAWGNIPAGGVP
jgi:hypothetical protein